MLEILINGLARGSVYALVALGYTMVYGILGMINFAHGEVFMIGMFAAVFALGAMGSAGLVAVGITLVIHAIGFWGLRQPEVFRYVTAEHAVVPPPPEPVSELPSEPRPELQSDPSPPRYERSGLSSREAEALKARLLAIMDDRHLYRSADLTLGDLAERLDTTPHRLSEVLNAQLGQSFYDFINGYRVREVQARLLGPDGARLTYLALALDAGFASKSTFNAVFKKHTGMTPSEYRRAQPG